MLVGEGVEPVRQLLRVNPAKLMSADVELSSVIAQDRGVAQKFMCLNAAPQCALGGDPDRVRRDLKRGEAQPLEMSRPRRLIGEPRL